MGKNSAKCNALNFYFLNFPAPPFNHISGICKNLADTWPAATRVLSRGTKREDPGNKVALSFPFGSLIAPPLTLCMERTASCTFPRARAFLYDLGSCDYQEPVNRNVQLPHIPVKGFSQTDLYLYSLNLPRIQTPLGTSVVGHKFGVNFKLTSLFHRKNKRKTAIFPCKCAFL